MYNYEWDPSTGGYILTTKLAGVTKELRPVFFEELELLGFRKKGWNYPDTDKPLLWAETRRYFYKGQFVAEANGGGLYSAPTLKVLEDSLTIEPVDVEGMIVKNKPLMDGIVQSTLQNIYNAFKQYKDRRYEAFYVAFSGGKDSLVLLDLVQRALPHNEFKVIFGDTTMEVSDTYKAIEIAKRRWNTLEFHTAQASFTAEESWKLFAPPGRTQRWCCSVHKSSPSILLLRDLFNNDNLKALVFDGIRAEESDARATYSMTSDGNKHLTQSNCSPLLDWNTGELYLYILENDLLLNDAYRHGAIRVGCSMCPMASSWWEYIANSVYHSDIAPFVEIIDNNAKNKFTKKAERDKYLNEGGWKGRMGGRDLNSGGNRIVEKVEKNLLTIYVNEVHSNWKEWIKAIGVFTQESNNQYTIEHKGKIYKFEVVDTEVGLKVSIDNSENTKEAIRFFYLFKNVFNKSAYCVYCKVCMVECPTGALIVESGNITINNKCKHCESCLDMPKGCLVAKSLHVTMGGNNMSLKGINRYQHFGFRSEWLSYYIELGDSFWSCDKLGKYQFDGFKVWLKEAEITKNNSVSEFGKEIFRLDVNDIRTWALILNNLVYHSTIVKWYVQNVEFGFKYPIEDIITLLGEEHSVSTRENAITSMKETFKFSPIGIELGLGNYETKGKTILAVTRTGWDDPDAQVILYSLFKFAEVSEGYYSFTLTDLMNDNSEREGISPAQIFGLDRDVLMQKIQGLALDYPDFITVAFNKDLDNINLNKERTSLEVVKMF